jgi:hypothetical protein
LENERSAEETIIGSVKNSIHTVRISENVVDVGFSVKSNSVIAFNNIRIEISSLK